jgi:hypothetical protein
MGKMEFFSLKEWKKGNEIRLAMFFFILPMKFLTAFSIEQDCKRKEP